MKKKTFTVGVMLFASTFVFCQQSEIPQFNSDAEKAAWISTHVDEYNALTGVQTVSSTSLKEGVPEFSTQEEKNAYRLTLNHQHLLVVQFLSSVLMLKKQLGLLLILRLIKR
jgi:hypothetical protein